MMVLLAILATACLNFVFSHSHMSAAELARHRFSTVRVPFLLSKRGWVDTEANRMRLMDEIGNRGHLRVGNIPEDVYMPPGCSCADECYAGHCEVADPTTCSFTQTFVYDAFGDKYVDVPCKSNLVMADYQETAGLKLSTQWMDCLAWNILPCYSPEISVFYTKALQQGVYADAQDTKAFPDIGSAIPNNVDTNRNFAEAGTNTPEAQADTVPEGGKIRTPRRKVLTLDVRVTYVYTGGDDYKPEVYQDADRAWCRTEKNGFHWDPELGSCFCLGKNDCEVLANNDGVKQETHCLSDVLQVWFNKAACKGHCRCKPTPRLSPDQAMEAAKTAMEGYVKDMHQVFGDHLQFKLSEWRKLDISARTGTPPTGKIKERILEKGVISLDSQALKWIMKQAKGINMDITKAPFRNPHIEVLVLPKARAMTGGEAFGDHMYEYDPHSAPDGVATILLNYDALLSNDGRHGNVGRHILYHEMGHILGLFHTFDDNSKDRLETKKDSAKMFLGRGKSQCLQCPVCTPSPHSWFNGDFIADTKAAGSSGATSDIVTPINVPGIIQVEHQKLSDGQCTAMFRKNSGGALGSGYCRPQYGMDRDPQNPDKYVVGTGSETNIMSYGTPSCQTELTLGQESRAVCFAEMNWQHVMASMAGQKGQTRDKGTTVTSPQPPSPVFTTLSRGASTDCANGKASVVVEWLPPISDMRCRESITVGGKVVKGHCAGKYTVWQKRSGTSAWAVVKTVLVPNFGKTKLKNAKTQLQYKSADLSIKSSYHIKVVASSWVEHSNGPTTYSGKRGYWNDGPAVEAFAPGNPDCGAPAYPAACPSCVTPASYPTALAKGPAYPGCGLKGQDVAKSAVLDETSELTRRYKIGTKTPAQTTTESAATTTAAATATRAPPGGGACKKWCSGNPNPWSKKCAWPQMCDGCPECSASFSTTAKPDQCQKWCANNAKPWSVKCAWDSKYCSACPECTAPTTTAAPTPAPTTTSAPTPAPTTTAAPTPAPTTTAAPTPAPTTTAAPTPAPTTTAAPTPAPTTTAAPTPAPGTTKKCPNWCRKNEQAWKVKCASWDSCSVCPECDASFSTTAKPDQCQKWCANNAKPWSVKCAWDSKDCSACPECIVMATTAAPTQAPATTAAPTPAPTTTAAPTPAPTTTAAPTPAPTTTAAPTPAPGTTKKCPNWCRVMKQAWTRKCSWDSCSVCPECDASFSTTAKPDQCQKWCANNAKPWSVKCAWDSKYCSSCPECTVQAFAKAQQKANQKPEQEYVTDSAGTYSLILITTTASGWLLFR